MKTYIVASNFSFTTICKASSKEDAILLAKSLYANKYDESADDIGLEAYEAEEYFVDNECVEIKLNVL
jgi:hypothetical protein